MMTHGPFVLHPIGVVESELSDRSEAPHQDTEGAPPAWLVIREDYAEGLEDIHVGEELLVLTWFHLAERGVLKVHKRNRAENPLQGVFSTRSPARPNPIGLHRVRVVQREGARRLRVDHLDALNGTPILDLKPVLKA
jgi:tRNA-Thr(GGU) m(6)t(6)A37 methyltransferase TsaA